MENLHPVTQRVKQFDAEHGDSEREGNWVYFEDGAAREAMLGGFGALNPPNADPRLRWRYIEHYHKLKLQRLMHEFDPLVEQLQAMLTHNLDNHLFEPMANRAEDLKLQIRRQKRRLEEAQEEKRRHEPGYVPPERAAEIAKAEAAREAERERLQRKLDKLKV